MSPAERARAAGWRRHEDAIQAYWDRPATPAEHGGSLINSYGRVDVCWTTPTASGSGWYVPDADRRWLRDEDEALAAALDAVGVQ